MCKRLIYLTSFVLVLVAIPPVTHAQVDNLALNPSFEEDEVILNDQAYEQWWTWGWEDGLTSTVEIYETEFVDGTRSLRVNPIGSINWYFIVANSPMPVEVGTNYTASFWAKAEEPRPLTANFKATNNSVTWGWTDFQLTTEWAEYSFTAEALNSEIKLEFLCAEVEVPFWLDFVFVYEATPFELLVILTQQVIDLNLQSGIENGLDAKLDAALKAINDLNENNDVAAINTLQAFINAVEAQRGKKIPEADADTLIADTQHIIDLLMAD